MGGPPEGVEAVRDAAAGADGSAHAAADRGVQSGTYYDGEATIACSS